MKTWETQKEESGKLVKALKIFLTVATSLYLPISRTVFQIFACDVGSMSTLKAALIQMSDSFAQSCALGKSCRCSDYSNMGLLYVIAIVLLLAYTIGFPIWLQKLIKKNVPVGSHENPDSRFDEDGIARPYTDKMYNDDVLKDPKQVCVCLAVG